MHKNCKISWNQKTCVKKLAKSIQKKYSQIFYAKDYDLILLMTRFLIQQLETFILGFLEKTKRNVRFWIVTWQSSLYLKDTFSTTTAST